MLGCRCLNWTSVSGGLPPSQPSPEHFSLPAPVPQWPPGEGFAAGKINLGEIEVIEITKFQFVWGCHFSNNWTRGFSFYKPLDIPQGFCCLGYYCQPNQNPLHGFVLSARDQNDGASSGDSQQPALSKPVDYILVWCSDDGSQDPHELPGYFWLPQPPQGYKSMGFVVTNTSSKPGLEEVRCVRGDLTDKCECCTLLLETNSTFIGVPLRVWRTRPCHRGMEAKGVSVGTFFCSTLRTTTTTTTTTKEIGVFFFGCLKNLLDPCCCWKAVPNLDQIHALITHYGPTVFFHPEEKYMPSSVSWFFESGALLYKTGDPPTMGQPIDALGSNLPEGGTNDHEFWIDLPPGDERMREMIKGGNLDTAELYAHIKPALGGTFTDIAMWLFCPFNGPAALKLGPMNVPLNGVGVHIGDWEHLTLRISNFSGRLHSVYMSQHATGVWVEAPELEFIHPGINKAAVYSSKSGHANFPRPGTYLQGSSKLGIGIRNDCARSVFCVDSSSRYRVVAAEYLGGEVAEPRWLQYMREWGPLVIHDSRKELDRVIKRFPALLRGSLNGIFDKLPVELFQEEGPTGPKEKQSWFQDERW